MGNIFGISDLPVSTIMTPFENITVPEAPGKRELEVAMQNAKKIGEKPDNVELSTVKKSSKSVISMRYGIGKLMKHYSKKV